MATAEQLLTAARGIVADREALAAQRRAARCPTTRARMDNAIDVLERIVVALVFEAGVLEAA